MLLGESQDNTQLFSEPDLCVTPSLCLFFGRSLEALAIDFRTSAGDLGEDFPCRKVIAHFLREIEHFLDSLTACLGWGRGGKGLE